MVVNKKSGNEEKDRQVSFFSLVRRFMNL